MGFFCFEPLLHSGFFGSGLAVFSRHRIHDVFLYKYSLNGYPYMVSTVTGTVFLQKLLSVRQTPAWQNLLIRLLLLSRPKH